MGSLRQHIDEAKRLHLLGESTPGLEVASKVTGEVLTALDIIEKRMARPEVNGPDHEDPKTSPSKECEPATNVDNFSVRIDKMKEIHESAYRAGEEVVTVRRVTFGVMIDEIVKRRELQKEQEWTIEELQRQNRRLRSTLTDFLDEGQQAMRDVGVPIP